MCGSSGYVISYVNKCHFSGFFCIQTLHMVNGLRSLIRPSRAICPIRPVQYILSSLVWTTISDPNQSLLSTHLCTRLPSQHVILTNPYLRSFYLIVCHFRLHLHIKASSFYCFNLPKSCTRYNHCLILTKW